MISALVRSAVHVIVCNILGKDIDKPHEKTGVLDMSLHDLAAKRRARRVERRAAREVD